MALKSYCRGNEGEKTQDENVEEKACPLGTGFSFPQKGGDRFVREKVQGMKLRRCKVFNLKNIVAKPDIRSITGR
ncbi:hypothetical protein F6Y04_01230 [Bacillus megaterium]|nr:hypothetical protein [Priestia megaterium]